MDWLARHAQHLALAVLAVFAPIQATLAATLAMVGADLVTGVVAAAKRGERVKSSKLRRTVVKVLVYEAAICLGFVTQRWLLMDAVPVVNLVAGLVGVVELKSVFENLDAIGGGVGLRSVVARLAPENQAKGGGEGR